MSDYGLKSNNIKNTNLIPPSPNIDINTLNPFTRFCCSIGAIPASYLVSMSYEEQLLWLCDFLENTIIPTVNNNGEAVTELQGLYIQLKDYVDNYFKNFDVQNEINNKLDEMVESGELQQIIDVYIKYGATKTYNNIEELKNDNSLLPNMLVRTLGYYSPFDNGNAFYKIVNEENISEVNKEIGLSEEFIKENEQKHRVLGSFEYNNDDKLFIAEEKVIKNFQ